MSTLLIVWWSCLGLATIAVMALWGLIIQRSLRNRRARREAARRDQLKQLAWQLIEQADQYAELPKDLRPEDRRLLLQLFSELVQRVTGRYGDSSLGIPAGSWVEVTPFMFFEEVVPSASS